MSTDQDYPNIIAFARVGPPKPKFVMCGNPVNTSGVCTSCERKKKGSGGSSCSKCGRLASESGFCPACHRRVIAEQRLRVASSEKPADSEVLDRMKRLSSEEFYRQMRDL